MRRIARILAANLRLSLALDIEYRADFLISLMTVALSLFANGLVLLVLFQHAPAVGGWTFYEALALYGVYVVFEELSFDVMSLNIGRLPSDIRDGSFDFVLLKPVSSQFLVSARRFPLTSVPSFLLGFAIIGVSMAMLGRLTIGNVALFLVLIGCGAAIMYGLLALLLTTSFWLVKVENITEIFHAAFATGRFPVTAFPGWLRVVLTAVVPVAFITTVPAAAAVGRLDWTLAAVAPLVAAALLWASRLYWRFALRHYTSASS